jgi:uncharacterized repeat protein (TIGR01451 family)
MLARKSLMLLSGLALAVAGMVVTTTARGLADTTIGPNEPGVNPPPFCETCWSSTGTPTGGEIGKSGGVNWSYTGVDTTQFTQAEWGLYYPTKPATFSFGDGTVDLAYDATASDLATGTLIFDNNSVDFPLPVSGFTSVEIRLVVQTVGDPNPSFEDVSDGLSGVDSSVGAVLPVTGDFELNLEFESSADLGDSWTGANDYFNNTLHLTGATTASSVDGAFWYTAAGAPAVSFGQNPLPFGTQPIGSSTSMDEVITNTGTSDLHVTEIDAGGDYSAPDDTCVGFAISAGDTCDITVDFDPSFGGEDDGTLTITDDASDSPQTLDLTGAGAQAQAVWSPNPLGFGPVAVGVLQSAGLTVNNPGTATLDLTNAVITGPNASDFSLVGLGTCPPSLAIGAGDNCTLDMGFTPGAAGPRSATVTFSDNANPDTQAVSLTGTGVIVSVTVLPNNADFGSRNVGTTSKAKKVTITNAGGGSIDVTGYTFTGADPGDFSYTGGSCPATPFTLTAGGACTVDLLFSPTAVGSRSATFTVTDDPGSQQVLVGGTGLPAADVAIFIGASASTVTSGSTETYTVVVENNGPVTATGVSFTDALPGAAAFVSLTGGTCSTPPPGYGGTVLCSLGSLASGASATFTITVTLTGRHHATVKNAVSVTASTFDPVKANNKASSSVSIQ